MTSAFSSLRINSDRMLDSFTRLSVFGSTPDGGVNRSSFSEAHLSARKWFREEIESTGFEFRTDGAGNHSAFLPVIASEKKQSPTLIIGSHLDSVPNGGKYDGGLGVVAAFEVLKILQENRIKLN
ncbi:MAG: Zn-dependent hydrolase, partial [Anaerolineales bacterium]|nr:Zn-dependent hydrolase [Anaerolineales bacterium]